MLKSLLRVIRHLLLPSALTPLAMSSTAKAFYHPSASDSQFRLLPQIRVTSCPLVLSTNHKLGSCEVESWGFSLLPKPVPSLVFPICKHSTKHSPHRGLVLGSCIPCPVASNSPELELDLTAEKQQDLIISHPKDYCKWPGPNSALPPSCPLILTSR